MQIGTAKAQSGTIQTGRLMLGQYPDGTGYSCPVAILQGIESGPVLWVQACIHGPEVEPIVAIHKVLRETDVKAVRGTVIFSLVCNPISFHVNERLTPRDGKNLNRVFPGNSQGSQSDRIAHTLYNSVISVADAVLDLHTGGSDMVAPHYAIYFDDGTETGANSLNLARSTGAPKGWNAPEDVLGGAAYIAYAKAGIPSVLFESGGISTDRDLDNFQEAIVGCCKYLGIIEGPKDNNSFEGSPFLEGGSHGSMRTDKGGVFIASIESGQICSQGDLLGVVTDLFGDTIESFYSPFPKAFINACRRTRQAVSSGDEVFSLLEIPL